MKAIAKPVEVEYGIIEKIVVNSDTSCSVLVNWGHVKQIEIVTTPMMARYVPKPGDYLVRQADGYEYLNPKDVFERKFRPVGIGERFVTGQV